MTTRTIGTFFVAPYLMWFVACGGSPAAPSVPPQSESTGTSPLVQLAVQADDAGSQNAITSLSEVVADASRSSGNGTLTFSIDFGDGTVANTAVARHTYVTPGTFTVTATITDARGQKATASRQLPVKNVDGRWFHAAYVNATARVEVRRLTITAQDGLALRGVYQVNASVEQPVTGTLIKPRNVRIVLNGDATLEGTLPSQVGDGSQPLVLLAHGDSVSGQRLEFRPIVGTSTDEAPDAAMKMEWDTVHLFRPIAGVTEIAIDGSSSRGSGLSYFIEYGDGQVFTAARAVHVVEPAELSVPPPEWTRPLTARLTVVDRFGRSDAESADYSQFEMANLSDLWYTPQINSGIKLLNLIFVARHGRTMDCVLSYGDQGGHSNYHKCIATFTDARDVRVVTVEPGWELQGSFAFEQPWQGKMTLFEIRGPSPGRTWTLTWKPYS